jgi:hypothetical protein
MIPYIPARAPVFYKNINHHDNNRDSNHFLPVIHLGKINLILITIVHQMPLLLPNDEIFITKSVHNSMREEGI